MRRFTVCALCCGKQEISAWEDTGFVPLDAGMEKEHGQRPDVVFLNYCKDPDGSEWRLLERLQPKLYVVAGVREIIAPASLSEIYEKHLMHGKDMYFTIGSSIEGEMTEPDWEAYRSNGRLSPADQIKAVAGAVYRYLLLDLFRETADWCGHMSSVVGPM